jgi:hypothetical protein
MRSMVSLGVLPLSPWQPTSDTGRPWQGDSRMRNGSSRPAQLAGGGAASLVAEQQQQHQRVFAWLASGLATALMRGRPQGDGTDVGGGGGAGVVRSDASQLGMSDKDIAAVRLCCQRLVC